MKKNIKKLIQAITNKINNREVLNDVNAICLKIKRFIQLDTYSCGIQCANAILNYYGLLISEDKLKNYINKEGIDTVILKEIFKNNRIQMKEKYNASFEDIKNSIDHNFPVLTTIFDANHWVIIYGYTFENDTITHLFILDPNFLRIKSKWPVEKFINRWREYDEKWISVLIK